MPSWFTSDDTLYNSRENYVQDNQTYLSAAGRTTQGCNYNSRWPSWSSNEALTASPITSISSASGIEVLFPPTSGCISPAAVTSVSGPHTYTASAWPNIAVNGWRESAAHDPTYERDVSMSSGASSEVAPQPEIAHKPKTPSHRGKKPSGPMALLPQPPPQPISGAGALPGAPKLIKLEAEVDEEGYYAGEGSLSPPTSPRTGHNSKRPQQANTSQLRTASRKAKRTSSHRPAASEEERRARASHNLVEKQYRNRLNAQFEKLLAVLPPPEDDDGGTEEKRLSKAEVLDIARKRIKALERERDGLKAQKEELSASIGRLREAVMRQQGMEEQ